MKAILVDWGGVIADDPGDGFLTGLLEAVGTSPEQIREIHGRYMRQFMRGEISEREYWEALRTHYGLSIDESISEEFKRWSGLVANREVFALVQEAKSKGWRTAILSNVVEPTYNALSAAGLYDPFDAVIASCKEGYAKPERTIYEIALQKLGAAAEESVFIDDKQSNLDPAEAMGFRTVLATNPRQIVADVKRIL